MQRFVGQSQRITLALIYQRATQDAADRIADGLNDLADRHRDRCGR
jgi:hypothetical protein